jgi:hypothetical protein
MVQQNIDLHEPFYEDHGEGGKVTEMDHLQQLLDFWGGAPYTE